MLKNIKFLVAILSSLVVVDMQAQDITVKLWDNASAPHSNNLEVEEKDEGQERISYTTSAELYIYEADPAKATGQAVVICPGGGYFLVAMGHEGHAFAKWFKERGITAAVLKYRMPNGVPDVPMEDAAEALRYMKEDYAKSSELKQVGIMGFSAGGHLAASTAVRSLMSNGDVSRRAQTRADFAILFYPVVTGNAALTHKGSYDNLLGADRWQEITDMWDPYLKVSAQTPPMFIVHSADDGGVNPKNSSSLYARLKEHDVPSELHILPTGGHGWGFNDSFRHKKEWTEALEKWLSQPTLRERKVQPVVENPHRYSNPTDKEFPVLAWFSLTGDQVTRERYEEMRRAGFNISFSHMASLEDIEQSLKAAKGTGVKVLIPAGMTGDNLEKAVALGRKNPTAAGYFLQDEPVSSGFEPMRQMAERIRKVDDEKMLYLNLLPNYVRPVDLGTSTYSEYVERFIKEVGLGMVSFDHYPVVGNYEVRAPFYSNLEDVSFESKRAGVPFWAFALSTAHDPYPVATLESMRLQIFANLAYGAQGIQYFTYTTPLGTAWNFHKAPIDENSQRTEVYDHVAQINAQVHALSHVFLGAQMEWVRHTGVEIPLGTRRLVDELPKEFKRLESKGDGVLVSHLTNGQKRYLMILNRDIKNPQEVTIECAEGVKRILPDGTALSASEYSSTLNIAAGDMLLFEF